MDYRDNRRRRAESHQVVHFYARPVVYFYSGVDTIADDLANRPSLEIVEWGTRAPAADTLQFVSTRRFKGMESKAVIVTDIDDVSSDRGKSILYVAMSRARTRLVVLAPEYCRTAIENRMEKAIERKFAQ